MSTSPEWITSSIGSRWTSTSNIERSDLVGVEPLAHRQVPLRVQVDHEDA